MASAGAPSSAAACASSSREIGYSTFDRIAEGLRSGRSPTPRAMGTFLSGDTSSLATPRGASQRASGRGLLSLPPGSARL